MIDKYTHEGIPIVTEEHMNEFLEDFTRDTDSEKYIGLVDKIREENPLYLAAAARYAERVFLGSEKKLAQQFAVFLYFLEREQASKYMRGADGHEPLSDGTY